MKYLIIGGGPSADSAAKEIAKKDTQADITIITEENFPPYRRLSLTKQAWTFPFEKLSLNTEAKIILGEKAVLLDETEQTVATDRGNKFAYDRLLIATGITPRRLSFEGLIYLRNYEDFLQLKKSLLKGKKVLVIGAGFTGLELSAELKKQGYDVTVIFPDDIPCKRVLPLEFCREINDTFIKNGVRILNNDQCETIEKTESGFEILTKQGLKENFDTVIASVGNVPNIPFDGLPAENGIAVNEFLETNIKNVYACGDVMQFQSALFGGKMRKEFMDNAIKSGKCAGANMTGERNAYNPVINSFFDAFDIGYKAVGEYGMNMRVSSKECKGGKIIFYRNENVLTGVVFWKAKPAFAAATKCIEERLTLSDEEYIYMMKLNF